MDTSPSRLAYFSIPVNTLLKNVSMKAIESNVFNGGKNG
jgi:hypothetical protein